MDAAADNREPRRALLWAPVLAAGLAGWGFLRALDSYGVAPGFPLDDSWIHMRFASNWARGRGFGVNPGEPTPGSTSPLWVALLAAAVRLGAGVEAAARGLGMLWSAAACAALMALAGRWAKDDESLSPAARRFWTPLGAGAFYALTPCAAWSAVSGLEIPLFMALSFAALWLHDRAYERGGARWFAAAAAFGLASNARPEGHLLFALAAAERLWSARRSNEPLGRRVAGLVGWFGIYAALAAPYAAFCLLTTGKPLPNTYYAKCIGGRDIWSRHYFQLLAARLGKEHFWLGLFAPLGLAALVVRRRGSMLPALWVVGLPAGYSCMARNVFTYDAGNFNRYFYPVIPLLAAFGVWGLARLAAAGRSRAGRAAPAFAALAAAFCLADSLSLTLDRRAQFAHNVRDINALDVAAAKWLAAHTPADARLCVCDAGAIPYFSDRYIYDTVGLVTPALIPLRRRLQAPGELFGDTALQAFLARTKPDYLVVFPDWYPKLLADMKQGRWARRVFSFHIDRNITCGGDTLVVYRLAIPAAPQSPECRTRRK